MSNESGMSFVFGGDVKIRGIFTPNALAHMKPSDVAEVALDVVPGRVFNAKVVSIVPAMAEGAITPSGTLSSTADWIGESEVVVVLELTDEMSEYQISIGTGSAVAIYTDRAKPIRIVRKIIIRIQAWKNYL